MEESREKKRRRRRIMWKHLTTYKTKEGIYIIQLHALISKRHESVVVLLFFLCVSNAIRQILHPAFLSLLGTVFRPHHALGTSFSPLSFVCHELCFICPYEIYHFLIVFCSSLCVFFSHSPLSMLLSKPNGVFFHSSPFTMLSCPKNKRNNKQHIHAH